MSSRFGLKAVDRHSEHRRKNYRTRLLWAGVGLCLAGSAHGQSQQFFVPMTVEQIRTWAQAIQNLPENNTIHTVISITATTDGTIVYYDHWEDGFEPSITQPLFPVPAGTTQVWGDQNCGNGFTPTIAVCNTPADDVVNAGDILILQSDVPANPRDPSVIFTDPGDKIATSERVTLTLAAWPSTGVQAQLGGATEVFPTSDWGTFFESPVGENLATFVPAAGQAFQFVALQITSQEDGTTVEVDRDGNGTVDTTLVLGEGQSAQVGAPGVTDVLVGATVNVASGAPVQVHLLTANEATTYEGRWYSLVPTADWGNTYYNPVGSTVVPGDGDSRVYLYNPGGSSIVVRSQQLSGCTNVTVPAGQVAEVLMVQTTPVSAARFVSDGTNCAGGAVAGGNFFAVGAIDRNLTIHDWGFTLIPESRLTPSAVVGWAPGSVNFTENASPVWVTAVAPPPGGTTLYVDYDGDPSTGPSTDPFGNRYDVSFTANDLQVIRINDRAPGPGCGGGDCDQTGMRIYTVDGTRITAAWGQDPAFSSSGQPQQLDMGTTVLPFASISAFKEGTLLDDLNNNGRVDVGDSLLYTIRIVNTGIIPIPVDEIFVNDTLDSGTDYIPGTTQSGGSPVTDDPLVLPGDTAFPLDDDPGHPQGYQLQPPPTNLAPGEEIEISFQVVVNASAVDPIVNQVAVTSGDESFADSSVNPLPGAGLDIVKTSSAAGSDLQPGQTLTYTVTVTNNSPGAVTGVQLVDALPAGTSYVANSTVVTGPRQIYVADRFRIARYDINDGPNLFLGPWDEIDVGAPPDSAVAGEVQVILGELRINNSLGGPTPSILRSVNLAPIAGGFAIARFDFRYDLGVDTGDALVFEVATSPAGPFTVLETFTGLDGDVDPFTTGTRGYDISAFIAAATTARFRVTSGYGSSDELFYVDNFEIRGVGAGGVAAQDPITAVSYAGGTGWAGNWVENDLTATPAQSPSAGDVRINAGGGGVLELTAQGAGASSPNSARRTVNLSGSAVALLTFEFFSHNDVDANDFIDVEVAQSPAGPYTLFETFDDTFANPSRRSYDITRFTSATTTVRFRIRQNYNGGNEVFSLQNIQILAGQQTAVTKDNVPLGANPDLIDGVPPLVARPGDGFALTPGQSLTATFQVLVNNPILATRVVNTATVTAHENPPPASASVIDPVSKGGAVGDRVWLDVDRDGVQDVGEPGLANVTVELRNGVCTPGSTCPTTRTDADGNYLFDRLAPGTYTVAVVASTLPGGGAGLVLAPGSASPSSPVTVTAEEIFRDVDFGYTNASAVNGILGDYVWSDADGDGVQDPGEIGIGGVVVDLIAPGPDGILGTGDDVRAATTTTAANGSYLFTGVAPGEYLVRLGAANFSGGGALVGYTATSGPQSIGSATSAPVTVVQGEVVTDLDFGYRNAALFSLSDAVWLDADSDGLRDAGERFIPGVTVDLLDAGGNLRGTAVTDANGAFTFSGLANGTYTLVITDHAGKLIGHQGTTAAGVANQLAVTVAGADASGVSFGYAAPGVIGDVVWSDNDGDGVQDPGEPGIAGVTIVLQVFNPSAGTWSHFAGTTTAADGTYVFEDLPPGAYRAVVTDTASVLAGYVQTGDPSVPGGPCAPACDGIGQSSISLDTLDFSVDFGYRNTARPDVSGTVFEDLDRNGFEDAGEPGIPGVDVVLVAAGPDLVFGTGDDLVVAETTTDANGDYVFRDLQAGAYQVAVRDPSGALEGYQLTSGLDRIPVTVAAADVTDVDFGYVRSTGTGSIGDTVWLDADPPGPAGPDGLRGPNEAGLPGVTVRLFRDGDGDGVAEPGGDDGAAIATTVTDANGDYRFTGLDAGRYFVDVDGTTLPASLTPTVGTTDPSPVIALSKGERFDDADFGYRPAAGTAILGDVLWYDADSDGLRDPGEVGIGGVDVTYVGAGPDGLLGTGDDVTATTTTAADGSYLFTGLAAGDYLVFFAPSTLPAGYNATPTNTGADSAYNVTVAAGDVLTHLDWGFNGGATGSIGDRIWLDLDADGNQDAGEPGLAGATVNLIGPGPNMTFGDADDEILATTASGAGGAYLFSGLPLGRSYQVRVTDVDGVLEGLNRSTALPGTLTPTAGTPDVLTADFGYAPAKGTGSIGSTIWRDLDFDGVRDAGEPFVEGVTVDVWLDVNGNGILEPGTDNRVRTEVTDANGEYEIKALPFGDYLVDVTDVKGVLAGMTKTTGPSPGADDNSQSDPYAVTLSSGAPRNVTADFGYRASAPAPLAISGTVFEDADADATFDSLTELVVPSTSVFLYRLAGNRRFLIATTVTDVNGLYSFGDLPPGSYEVAVDTTATSADGFLQTTQSSTGGVQPVTLSTASSTGNDFGFFDGGVTTTPVTLSYFETRGDAGWAEVAWQTVTEVGHVGFNLWVWRGGSWARLNERIIPSSGADALELRSYRFEARDAGGTVFLLEDLDILGTSRYHGPFELGEAYGRKDLESEPIPWKTIGAEHAALQAERLRAATNRLRHKAAGGGSARLLVDEAGVYRVTYEELAAAGLDLAGVAAAQIAVLNRGGAVPARVEPSGLFGPGSFIELIGEGLDTLYTKTNVYVVTVAPSQADRIRTDGQRPKGTAPASYRETLRVEHDRAYSFAAPNGDPWYDTHVLAFGSPASASFAFETEGRLAGAGPAATTVGLWGVTDWHQAPDHHVVVEVNGVALAEAVFDGTTDRPLSFEVPESVLAAGENTLRVVLPADNGLAFELVNVDHFSVTYPRRFEARDGALKFTARGDVFEVAGLPDSSVAVYRQTARGVQLLTGAEVTGAPGAYRVRFPGDKAAATYHVASAAAVKKPRIEPGRPPANLRSGAAELLVISHPDFLGGLDRLVGMRQAQGWSVKVVDVEDVYEEFGSGIFDPRAIRDYVAFAHRNLETRAVLLVGGDTYDYHDVLGLGGVSFIPSLYGPTGQFVRFAPADGLFTDVDGDEVPDLAIGRFPVRTAADLAAIVDKTLGYEARADRRTLVLAADDYDEPSRFDFAVTSEQLASLIPGDWRIDRVYADVLGQAGARAELLAKLDAGPAVTSFMGHSGPTTWSFDGLFSADDAAALANAEPTMVAQWGCWTTYYVSPFHETLGHKLLLSGDRGAAAVLGATTLTEARSERALALEIFRQLFGSGRTLGDAVLEAKRRLAAAADPAVVDVLIGWNLLGDPTLGLAP